MWVNFLTKKTRIIIIIVHQWSGLSPASISSRWGWVLVMGRWPPTPGWTFTLHLVKKMITQNLQLASILMEGVFNMIWLNTFLCQTQEMPYHPKLVILSFRNCRYIKCYTKTQTFFPLILSVNIYKQAYRVMITIPISPMIVVKLLETAMIVLKTLWCLKKIIIITDFIIIITIRLFLKPGQFLLRYFLT